MVEKENLDVLCAIKLPEEVDIISGVLSDANDNLGFVWYSLEQYVIDANHIIEDLMDKFNMLERLGRPTGNVEQELDEYEAKMLDVKKVMTHITQLTRLFESWEDQNDKHGLPRISGH